MATVAIVNVHMLALKGGKLHRRGPEGTLTLLHKKKVSRSYGYALYHLHGRLQVPSSTNI